MDSHLLKYFINFRIREALNLVAFNLNIILFPEINLNPLKDKNEDPDQVEVYPGKIGHPKKKDKPANNTETKEVKREKRKVNHLKKEDKPANNTKAKEVNRET